MFIKGQCANPNGRPKGSRDFLPELLLAIKRSEKKTGVKLMDRFVEMALEDSKVMVALMKKIVADKMQTDNTFKEPITIIIKGKGDLLDSGEYQTDSTNNTGPGRDIPLNAQAEVVGTQ